ncbi:MULTISPECIES: DUF4998 domain-containing protein [Flavobacterium]|uniref:DUF4998 domain-containing protein n=1 Tax=Flavobacterium TaxID=237 RepID=UPI001889E699|nr:MULTISPECIES: DUF4998 domain-containing protein [Flavobacterium]MBF4470533.1 DUF5013 domain-containing protein [Flavobacterium sp. HJJ]
MNTIKKYFVHAFAFLLAAVTISSCTSMDDGYKDFIKDGEISYTGKIDSLHVYSGKNRVQVKGLFISDPKITECRIYWDNRKDSVVVPVTRTQGIDVLDVIINGLVENVHNFEVRTFDKLGNTSIPVYKIGTVYGDRYITSLYNRPIASKYFSPKLTTINFASMDLSSGAYAVELTYTNTSDAATKVQLPIAQSSLNINDFKMGSSFTYKTLFRPNAASIDTFESVTTTVTGNEIQYLNNNYYPFTRLAYDNARWGVPAEWVVSASAKSHTVSGVTYGGLDALYFSLESGWGQPAITNGKVYQTMTLPAGTYIYSISINATSYAADANDQGYFLIAKGNTLPDVTAVEASANTLKWERVKNVTPLIRTLSFTLAADTQVSVGVVSSSSAMTSSTGRHLKINYFKLVKQ